MKSKSPTEVAMTYPKDKASAIRRGPLLEPRTITRHFSEGPGPAEQRTSRARAARLFDENRLQNDGRTALLHDEAHVLHAMLLGQGLLVALQALRETIFGDVDVFADRLL